MCIRDSLNTLQLGTTKYLENLRQYKADTELNLSYMVDALQYALLIADKYDYDRIAVGYEGKVYCI